ncbi:lysine--tRNA ligase [bacterium]|nr:MAG: lysine--tRNA ligase [bacterium]
MSNIGQSLQQVREFRVQKLNKLKELGFDPYPARVQKDKNNAELINNFDELQGKDFFITGRIVSIRSYGKLLFLDVQDESGKIQCIGMPQNVIGLETKYLEFGQLDLIDNGDFVEVFGTLGKSKTGEISILVKSIRIITKSLRPIPDELNDVEERQRKRYLDINVNGSKDKLDLQARFERRSKFWQANRDFLNSKGFIEMNMPVLELTTGGADANPFVTHMDAIDQDFYLRISHELPLKRLIGAGYEKVYDIGPRFRNEGFSDEHLPEHIAMEWYWAYADFQKGMEFMEEMFKFISYEVWGTTKFENMKGFEEIDLEKKWEVITYEQILQDRFGIDIWNVDLDKVNVELAKFDDKAENINRGIDKLWKKIRATIGGPVWMIYEPAFLSPLAKPSDTDKRITERFHPIIAGSELGNGFSELNDPQLQLQNFLEQEKLREEGDAEAQMLDDDFVEMLEYGMPPTCGWGHAERNFWFFENVSAREGVIFPPMRRK